MFRGSSFHTIDPKGRIVIPTRFRDVIQADGGPSIMITRMDHCLFAYTLAEWSKLEQKILDIQVKSETLRRFQRIFVGGAHDCKCDKQGRVLIPPTLKHYAQLEKEIVLVGVLDRFEIWSRQNWEREEGQMEQDLSDDDARLEVAQLGL
jgi:MraZ protein